MIPGASIVTACCTLTILVYVWLGALQVAACVNLMGALVQSGGPSSRTDPRQSQSSTMPVEVLRAMREAGAVKALAQALQLVSTEHPQVSGWVGARVAAVIMMKQSVL